MPVMRRARMLLKTMLAEACRRKRRASRGSAMRRGKGADSPIAGERGDPGASPCLLSVVNVGLENGEMKSVESVYR